MGPHEGEQASGDGLTGDSDCLATDLTVLAAWTATVERREVAENTCFFMRAAISV